MLPTVDGSRFSATGVAARLSSRAYPNVVVSVLGFMAKRL
jgi:hypothetical protein